MLLRGILIMGKYKITKERYLSRIQAREKKPLHILYLIALLLVIILLICILFTRTKDYKEQTKKNYENINDSWRISPNSSEPLDLRNLGKYCEEDAKTLYLYCKIPNLEHDTTLLYRSKDVYTSLYIDGKKIYETSVPDSRFYNKSPGNLWNEVLLDKSSSGKMLTMRIDIVYDTSAVTVDSFALGDGTNIIRHFVNENLLDIFISILMILMGLMFIIIDIVFQDRAIRMGHGLMFLGIYAFLLGIWCLLETNVIQLFVSDQRILQFCNNILMITAMLPLFLYLDYSYNILKKPVTLFLCVCNLIYIYVCIFAQFTGLSDLHNLLGGIQISLVLSVVLFARWSLASIIDYKKRKQDLVPIILQMCGIGSLMLSVTIEFLNYKQGDLEDRAGVFRIGTLFFILFFGMSSQIQTRKLIVKGIQYNVVKDLAYSDGLTAMGNRTAFRERVDTYIGSERKKIGMVYLDINNLKYVNDNFGHEYGNDLIINAAEVIEKSYGEYGYCYRIGGDEFCVLIEDDEPEVLYEEATKVFKELVKKVNEDENLPYKIEIAQGFSVCSEMTREKLQKNIEIADAFMYEDKRILKENRSL